MSICSTVGVGNRVLMLAVGREGGETVYLYNTMRYLGTCVDPGWPRRLCVRGSQWQGKRRRRPQVVYTEWAGRISGDEMKPIVARGRGINQSLNCRVEIGYTAGDCVVSRR